MDRDERKQFARYISRLREKQGITMKQLCEGLLSDRAAMFIEQGKRDTSRSMREALLERLGVGAEDSECCLGCEEYAHWKAQQQILHSIACEEMEQAQALVEKYWTAYCGEAGECGKNKEKLDQQFYFVMLAQIRRYNGNPALQGRRNFQRERDFQGEEGGQSERQFRLETDVRGEVAALFEKALKLTVPAWEEKPVSELTLSLKELHLLLETVHYRTADSGIRHEERLGQYREIIEYITKRKLDRRGMAKIYPKAVYYLCRCLMEEYDAEEPGENIHGMRRYQELLTYCNRALKILRDNGRMYYLWEILDMREQLFGKLADAPGSGCGYDSRNQEAFRRLRQENASWRQVLEDICQEFNVPKETFHCCYLYVSKGVCCTNDVIRIRSGMLGIRGEELCDGVCSIKTLRRIRNGVVSPQREVVEGLFDKLGLSGELVRTEIVTGVPEARELMERLREHINARRWREAEKALERIKQLISMEFTCNRQAILRKEVLLSQAKNEINQKECYRRLREALELTLPYEAFLEPGEKYLTHEEQSCIRNMMVEMDERSDEFIMCVQRFEEIYQPIIDRGELENVESMYEFIMGYVRSYWGNTGDFVKADKYDKILIEGCLRFGRIWYLHDGLYDRWWNHNERKKKGIPTNIHLDDEEELKKCILFSELVQSAETSFYQKKLRQINGKSNQSI